jgi:2-oxo-4-hydroxy-4-carboxy-5-ureidoimidazoline decarboxylase
MTKPDISSVNAMPADQFVRLLGGIFEHSPWVARRAATQRPFRDVDALHGAMVSVVERAGRHDQLELLRAHPELAGGEGATPPASSDEQSIAVLHALSASELARMTELNVRYRERFGFPFILAVRNRTREAIFAELERRLANDADVELSENLRQIYAIARMRLALSLD